MKSKFINVSSLLVLAVLILIPKQVQGVEEFKVSSHGDGVQIWFEAEAFDERSPEGDRHYRVKTQEGAFGKAVTPAGVSGGMIRWDFDISAAGGKADDWYFWGRIHNKDGASDYMLVRGDKADKVIPDKAPYPGGDGAKPFDNLDDRIFETNMPKWAWWGGGQEGSIKELQDGQNTMYIFHRQGNSSVSWDVFLWSSHRKYFPTDEDYEKATPMKVSDLSVRPLEKLSTTWGGIKNDTHSE